MATDTLRVTVPLPVSSPHLRSRLLGLGSIFGKTLRDARLPMLIVAGLLGVIAILGGGTMASTYGTPLARLELAQLSSSMPPALRGLYGDPVNVDTLGGFISWHYSAYFALLAGLWSIMALASTLAGEARRGSLDLALATARSRQAIALEKVAGHVSALAIAMAIVAFATWSSGAIFARLPGDAIDPGAAIAFAAGVGLRALVAGGVAFALAPWFGRGAAAGIAGALMLAGYVVQGYRSVVPVFDALAGATWFSWTADHIPLAGRTDWPALLGVAVACAILLALGVMVFTRRDVGVTVSIPIPSLPRMLLGVRGPLSRSFGDLLPAALAWGIGLGVYGIVMAVSSRPFADALAASPELAAMVRRLVPGIDMTAPAGFLQLAFAEMGFLLAGLAVATFIAGRSSDETSGRLELQLSTPLTRARWAVTSAIATWLALVVVTALLGACVAIGVASLGEDAAGPALGMIALLVYGGALVGIGVAVAGLSRAAWAAPAVLAVAIGTSLVDLLAPALDLPDWVAQLALTEHLGDPMVGRWDLPGMALCLALAVGGIALGALGMSRRDVRG
jgi:ABC-2 type transport system permease protein